MDAHIYSDMTLRDYLRVVFRQKTVIILSFATVVTIVFMGLTLKTPVYQAQVKMLISAEKLVEATYYQELNAGGHPAQATVTQSEIVMSSPVLSRTVQALRLDLRPLEYEKKFASPIRSVMVDLAVAHTKASLDRMAPPQQA